jgi:hypothetical protein
MMNSTHETLRVLAMRMLSVVFVLRIARTILPIVSQRSLRPGHENPSNVGPDWSLRSTQPLLLPR